MLKFPNFPQFRGEKSQLKNMCVTLILPFSSEDYCQKAPKWPARLLSSDIFFHTCSSVLVKMRQKHDCCKFEWDYDFVLLCWNFTTLQIHGAGNAKAEHLIERTQHVFKLVVKLLQLATIFSFNFMAFLIKWMRQIWSFFKAISEYSGKNHTNLATKIGA